MIQAYHLPAIPHPPTTPWAYGSGERQLQLRLARVTPALLAEQIDALLEAREEHLAPRPVMEIVRAIDRVAERLLDPADELRRAAEAALPFTTGASRSMVARTLDGLAADCRAPQLLGLLRAEFGDPEVLDGFRPRGRAWGSTRAFGPRLATHLFGAGAPTAPITSLVRSLLVKAATLGKTTTTDPLLPALFARTLAEVDAGIGRCIAVAYWPAGDAALDRVALDAAEAVVAHGAPDVIAAARARAAPGTRFLGYPPRTSLGVVAREALDAAGAVRVAELAALDVAMFDQQACSSPHLFYVEEGGDAGPAEWARLLAAALERLERELPRGVLSPGEAAELRRQRTEAPAAGEMHAPAEGTAWTVIFDPDPAFHPSSRNRLVRVKPVPDLLDVVTHVQPIASSLQTIGVAGSAARVAPLAAALAELGASRVAPIGSTPWPPASWHHDGHSPLRALVRWCDYE